MLSRFKILYGIFWTSYTFIQLQYFLSSNTSIFNDYGIYFASPISGGGGFQFFMATLTIPTAEILGKK